MIEAPADSRLRSLIADSFDLPPEEGVLRLRGLLSDAAAGAGLATMSDSALATIKAGFPRAGHDRVSFATLCRLRGRVDMLQAAFEMQPPAGQELCGGTANWLNQFCWSRHLDRLR